MMLGLVRFHSPANNITLFDGDGDGVSFHSRCFSFLFFGLGCSGAVLCLFCYLPVPCVESLLPFNDICSVYSVYSHPNHMDNPIVGGFYPSMGSDLGFVVL